MKELLLATDATKHPQTGHRVGAEGDELARLFPLLSLTSLQGAQDEREGRDQDRYADQDDQAQRPRLAEQDDRHDDVAHDRSGEAGGHVIPVSYTHLTLPTNRE